MNEPSSQPDDGSSREQQRQHISARVPESVGQGVFSTGMIVMTSGAEFILDFTRMLPGVPKAKVFSRIIMTPQHAKSLSKALNENIEKFEKQHGEIKVQGMDQGKSFGFQPAESDKKDSK